MPFFLIGFIVATGLLHVYEVERSHFTILEPAQTTATKRQHNATCHLLALQNILCVSTSVPRTTCNETNVTTIIGRNCWKNANKSRISPSTHTKKPFSPLYPNPNRTPIRTPTLTLLLSPSSLYRHTPPRTPPPDARGRRCGTPPRWSVPGGPST